MKKITVFLFAILATVSLMAAQYAIQPTTPNASDNIRRAVRGDVAGLADGDTLLLVTGDYYEYGSIEFNAKKNLVLMAAEGQKPVVHQGSYMKIYVPTTLDGIHFEGGDTADYSIYIYKTAAQKLVVKNCEIEHIEKYAINGSSSETHIDSIIVDNCFFHDNGRSAVYASASTLADNVPFCTYLSFTNSTVANAPGCSGCAVIDIRNNNNDKTGNATTLVVDHVTIYGYTADNGAIMSYKSPNVAISNTIIMNPTASDQYATYCYGGTIKNCMIYNTKNHKSGPTVTACTTADPLFVDAAHNDFTLGTGSPALTAATDGGAIGDPRWVKSEPGTGLVEVTTNKICRKVIIDGKMLIIKDGKAYNVLGF